MNTDHKCLKIVYLFVTYSLLFDDVIVTSVNTYMSMMGITLKNKDKYLIISLPENKKYGGKRLLKCFIAKTGALVD